MVSTHEFVEFLAFNLSNPRYSIILEVYASVYSGTHAYFLPNLMFVVSARVLLMARTTKFSKDASLLINQQAVALVFLRDLGFIL